MIVGVTGNPHGGKTLCLTMFAMDALDKGMQVFANYHITYKPKGNVAQFIDLGKLAVWIQKEGRMLKPDSGMLVLTEAYKGMDSYRSRSNANLLLSYFILQARHFGFRDVYYDAQLFTSVHKRVRINTEMGIRATKFGTVDKPSFHYMMQDFRDAKTYPFEINTALYLFIRQYYNTWEKIKSPTVSLDPKMAKKMLRELEKEELKEWDAEEHKGEVNEALVRLKEREES